LKRNHAAEVQRERELVASLTLPSIGDEWMIVKDYKAGSWLWSAFQETAGKFDGKEKSCLSFYG
jgi:hypothetical protein